MIITILIITKYRYEKYNIINYHVVLIGVIIIISSRHNNNNNGTLNKQFENITSAVSVGSSITYDYFYYYYYF